ncbi:uncharacterized protein LOC122400708 [Colletes gigas]|uniref:uncharacterized protein LOC122400708 n=1 Tax=Colletes gigas TaxID=935657 RepID=UPI001C9AE912|nr:uncharacterized protein LOC122400708 [Colletes gigas]
MYLCIICQHANISITYLHDHYVQHHTPQELSHAIINLQGLKFIGEKSLKSIMLGDNNNNGNLCNQVVAETEKQNSHDETYCLLYCSQFIVWEQELNKRTEICDDDFFNIIDDLCTDLSKKTQKKRKRENKALMSKIKTDNIVQHNEDENIQIQNKNMETFNNLAVQISTASSISSWNIESSNINTVSHDKILKSEINEEVATENDTPLTILDIDANKNVLMYNSSDDTYFWTSMLSENFD